jgi:glycosyltransferase 2 family protein
MKKRIILFFVFLCLGIALFTGTIIRTGPAAIWANLSQLSFLNFLFFLFLSTLNFCLYTLRWEIILRHIHEPHPQIPFWKLFLHRMSAFALSYLTPTAQTGGEPLRIMLLQEDNVPAKTAASSVIIDKALEFAALFVFIGVGITLALIDGSLPGKTEFFFAVILVVIVSLIFWFYYSSVRDIGFFSSILRFTRLTRFSRIKTLEQKFVGIEKQMSSFYKKHLRVFLFLILISLIISAFLLLEHYLVARFLGVRLTFFQTFLCSTIPYIAYLVPIPGGLGLLESGHAAVFAMLGININAFVLVFIIRMRDFIFVAIGLMHASKQGIKMLKEAFFNK